MRWQRIGGGVGLGEPTQVQQPELAVVSVASLSRIHGAKGVQRHQGLDSASHPSQKLKPLGF